MINTHAGFLFWWLCSAHVTRRAPAQPVDSALIFSAAAPYGAAAGMKAGSGEKEGSEQVDGMKLLADMDRECLDCAAQQSPKAAFFNTVASFQSPGIDNRYP
ncbi:hypothetical protein [Polaromonas glacialis]|uniref:hypothetical protein n=1 Tax=Polaromonas glacialis TaxID=866564 RepID=UPI0012EB9174|nr:hypothetical protein [Polaromonas glacialis]